MAKNSIGKRIESSVSMITLNQDETEEAFSFLFVSHPYMLLTSSILCFPTFNQNCVHETEVERHAHAHALWRGRGKGNVDS